MSILAHLARPLTTHLMTTPSEGDSEKQPATGIVGWFERTFSEETRTLMTTWGRRILMLGVVVLLIRSLYGVGWANVWEDIPTQPLFYLIFVGMYLGLPVAESFIYRIIWGASFSDIFPVLIKKRVFNKEVLNYSGEANLFLWAKDKLDKSRREILVDIKDNTIVSSLASMLVSLTLLSTFLLIGVIPFELLLGKVHVGWILGGGFCLAMLIALAIRFRKTVISLPARIIRTLFGIHIGRLLFVQSLQILQWMTVMPDVPIVAWFIPLSVQIVTQQIPFMPSKDLLVAAAAPAFAGWIDVSASGMTSMLLVTAALDKLVNFVLFSYLSIKGK